MAAKPRQATPHLIESFAFKLGGKLPMAVSAMPEPPCDEARACKGAPYDIFYPEVESGASLVRARSVCVNCPVYEGCMDYAIRNHDIEHGIWAGWTEEQRHCWAGGYFYYHDWRNEDWTNVHYRPRPLRRRPGRRHLRLI